MSNSEDFYSSRATSAIYTSTPVPDLHKPEPPPPPPPKSTSHEPSRQGTPTQNGPPLPPLPQGHFSPASGSPMMSTPQPPPHPAHFHQSQAKQARPPIEPQIRPPSVSDKWIPPVLQDKVTTDLAPILSDPTLLSALATSHPSYTSSQVPLSEQLSSNIALATHVQETANKLTQLREQTQALLLQHTTLSSQWRRKQSDMDKALEPWSPKAKYQRLVASIVEQEAIVRAIEESFLEGGSHLGAYGDEGFYSAGGHGTAKASDRDIGDWVKRIRENVQILEMRKEMRERWDEGRVGGWR